VFVVDCFVDIIELICFVVGVLKINISRVKDTSFGLKTNSIIDVAQMIDQNLSSL
jgi:hypothetical protein